MKALFTNGLVVNTTVIYSDSAYSYAGLSTNIFIIKAVDGTIMLQCNQANESCGLPGMMEPPGSSARNSRKELPVTVLSRRRDIYSKGNMVISTV